MSDMPEWLENEVQKLPVHKKPDARFWFKKCYQLMREQQKPRPIETAPKSRVPILLIFNNDIRYITYGFYGPGVKRFCYEDKDLPLENLTHWLPLPQIEEE